MKRLLNIILYVVLAMPASAQTKVTGRVIDLQNKPVSDVIVKLVSGSKTLAFTSSNALGVYNLEVKNAPNGEVTLQFTHISYEKESERVMLKERVTKLDMILTPKSISLKEVTVKPDPLRQKGDTLTHNLASFLGKGDVTLEDGLKRLPGVDVSKNGGISYMGKPISQFNIEGLDMLGGKYNLATRNIPADYVTNVEIVRNHHSRRVEKDVPSNEVSMNIKLSKKAKLKPFGQEEAGIGVAPHSAPEGATIDPQHGNVSPSGDERGALRALLGLTGMMFTDKFQTICSLKGGNYKNFARADMYDHSGGSDVTTPATSLFGGFDGGAPPQGEYLYQRNGMATLNGIHKLDSATTVKVNADYSYHRATHDISQSSTYLAGDGSYVTVSEQTSPLTKVHLPKLSVNYLKNADRMYLSETFVLKGKFEQNEGDVISSVALAPQQTEQRRKTSSFEVGNDLFWMGRTEKGTRRHVNASVAFRRTPTLRLSIVNDGQGYGQTAQSSTLSMNVGSSFQIPIGKTFRLNLPVSVSAMYDDLETIYSPPSTGGVGGGSVNDIRGWSFTPSINPGFEIHSRNRRFYLSAGLGAALKGLYYNKMNYTKPVLNPSMGINYTFSANSKLSFSTGYFTEIGDMLTLLTEPMQVDYRTVRTSSGIIGESNSWGTSGEWKWQLPMQYFTLSVSASHNETKRNTLTSQSISGIDISTSALQRDTRSRSTNFSVAATKNFPSLFAKLGADASYGFGDSEQAISSPKDVGQEGANIIKVRSSNYNLHGNASVTPIQWLELRYDIRYGWSRSRYSEESNTVTSLTHSGAIHVFPIATLDLSLDYDHVRRQITTDTYKRMSLFNASAQYKWKQCVLRLELTNLLNQRSYSYTVFDGINTYTYDYGLCGRTALMRLTFKL
ncbi:MAG: carboxypeptidase-like regulatory domain-containing protein [Prevotella sp.]|nr:carboxypeptidase-like regulatory domain-containing protein [Prevotella sp.]